MGNDYEKEKQDSNIIQSHQPLPIQYLYPPRTEWLPTEYELKKQVFIKRKIKKLSKSRIKLFPT